MSKSYHLKPLEQMSERGTFEYKGRKFTKKSFWKALRVEAEQLKAGTMQHRDAFFWFKVVDESNGACSGGNGFWPAPRNQRGSQVPGDWTRDVGDVSACHRGYHLCPINGLQEWWGHGRRVYLAEWAPDAQQDYSSRKKVAVSVARLVRYLGQMNLNDGDGQRAPFHKYPTAKGALPRGAQIEQMAMIDMLPIILSPKLFKAHIASQKRQAATFNKKMNDRIQKELAEARQIAERRAQLYGVQRRYVIDTLSRLYFNWCNEPQRKPYLEFTYLSGPNASGVGGERLALWWLTQQANLGLPRISGLDVETYPDMKPEQIAAVMQRAQWTRARAVASGTHPDQLKLMLASI